MASAIRNLAQAMNLVAVEWTFEAVHKGPFANVQATGKRVPEPVSESTDLYLWASGRVAVDGPTSVGNVPGGASVIRGDVTEMACARELRFTFLRKD